VQATTRLLGTKKKTKVLLLRIDADLDFRIDCYCLNHMETNKSAFIRKAIRDKLDQVSAPTYVEPKITIPIPVPAPKSVPVSADAALKQQWAQEEAADMDRYP